METKQYDFGLVGLGVMGRNFILNVAENGFSAFGLDTSADQVAALKEEGKDFPVDGSTDKVTFVGNLSKPRKRMIWGKEGKREGSGEERGEEEEGRGETNREGKNEEQRERRRKRRWKKRRWGEA